MYELAESDGDPNRLADFRGRSFDLGTGWLLRLLVSRNPSGARSLEAVPHHIAADLYGFDVLCAELQEVIGTLARRAAPALPPAGSQPIEIAAYEQSAAGIARNERAIAYWMCHDDVLAEVLTGLRGRFDQLSTSMHLARVACTAPRLAELAILAHVSEGAVVVATIARVLAAHLGCARVPMQMLVLNRTRTRLETKCQLHGAGAAWCA
jgi:hypothetical protein